MRVAIVGGTGSFGRALAKRLGELGTDEVVVGSRDVDRARATAEELGVDGAVNQDAVRDADLVVLAVKSDATLQTASELADAIGTTPVLCVASDLRFTAEGVLPGRHQGSLAEEVARIVRAPVASGFQSFAAANVIADLRRELRSEDARTRARRAPGGARNRRRPPGQLPRARGHDGRDPQRQQALQGPRRNPAHGDP